MLFSDYSSTRASHALTEPSHCCRCPRGPGPQPECRPGFLGFADQGVETIVREAPRVNQGAPVTPPRATQAYPQTPTSAGPSTGRQGHPAATTVAPRSLNMEFNRAAPGYPAGQAVQQVRPECADIPMEVCPYSASHGVMLRQISRTTVCSPLLPSPVVWPAGLYTYRVHAFM